MDDHEAFLDEMLPHLRSLTLSARRLGCDPDDLVQETYLRAFAARRSYRKGSNARAWLSRIMVNAAMSEHRRNSRDRRLAARVAELPRPRSPEAELPAQSRELRVALGRLSSTDREVVSLADIEGLRYREMARRLGCPIGTVMSRLFRARRRLRAQLVA